MISDIRLVAIDIDGTLIDNHGNLSSKTIDVLGEITRKGIDVTLATGRTFHSATLFAKRLQIQKPIIAYNGAYIAELGKTRPFFHQPMEFRRVQGLLELLQQYRCYIKMYVNEHLFVQSATDETRTFSKLHEISYTEVGKGNLSRLQEDPLKIVIIDSPEQIGNIYDRISDWHQHVTITKSSQTNIEIVHRSVNKGFALQYVCDAMNLHMEQVMAFGNEANDIEMIQKAGHGVAMGNAIPALKDIADEITLSNDENGVAHLLEKYFLS